ncbi:MAG: DUF481 domain-containing protein [Candidatus Hydrogenedentes bacterium]|nr:DUF481 domain-containing protein [Candidatus Hydrogenedentota bacterium]
MIMRIARFLIPCLFAGLATGDVLTLSGGESVQGQLLRIRSGVIQFKTTLEGQIMAPADTVEAIATDRNLVLTLNDESILFGKLATESGENQFHPLDNGPASPIALADIKEAMPIPSPPAKDAPAYESALESWKSSVQTGIRWQDNAKDDVDAFLRLETERRLKDHLAEMNLSVERGDPDDFPSFLEGTARISAENDGAPGIFGEITAERNTFNALDLRTGLALGLHWRATGAASGTDWHAGLQVAHESHDNDAIRNIGFERREEKEESALNLQLGLRYARILHGNAELSTALTLYPSLTDLGDLRARSETAYTLPLAQRLQLRLELAIEYESDPVFGALDPFSASFGASLGVEF